MSLFGDGPSAKKGAQMMAAVYLWSIVFALVLVLGLALLPSAPMLGSFFCGAAVSGALVYWLVPFW